jgi:ABC-type bacteriocin/lantibiotic exporter with double-glycine peptidase domain
LCGPSALSSVFLYYGINITQQEIANYCYTDALKGSLITDLKAFAEKKGFLTIFETGDMEDIKKQILLKRPVIVLVDLGFWIFTKPHYIVIYGFDEEGFLTHTGYEKERKLNYNYFENIWSKIGKTYLVVYK